LLQLYQVLLYLALQQRLNLKRLLLKQIYPTEDVVIECLDESLDGIKAKISVRSEQTDFDKRGYVTLDSSLPYNTFDFSSDKNGIFTVAIKLSDATMYSIFRECLRKGFGLGLSLVKKIAEIHSAECIAESEIDKFTEIKIIFKKV